MATRAVRVRKSQNQEDLKTHREHCSADAHALSALGIIVCQQVRVKRSDSAYALYTVSEVRHEDTEEVVRMGLEGRLRLGIDDVFDAEFDSQVVDPTMSDKKAKENGEFIERLRDDGAHTGLIVIAPHGGQIEEHTDEQAQRVADSLAGKPVSFWLCKGFKGPLSGAFDAWHITAGDIHPGSFPLLNSVFCRRFSFAVAFHGLTPGAHDVDVLVGGMVSPDLKDQIASTISNKLAGSNISVRVAGPDDVFNGDDPSNLVNRLTIGGRNGVQIEQSLSARDSQGDKIAEAVAEVYGSLL
jgi:phage replication-related protein YjqB (UPF0714/DUF867 family)